MTHYRLQLLVASFRGLVLSAEPLVRHMFEAGQQPREPAQVKSAHDAPGLRLQNPVQPTRLVKLPIADGSLRQMKLQRFWLKTDIATAVAVLLPEKKFGIGMSGRRRNNYV